MSGVDSTANRGRNVVLRPLLQGHQAIHGLWLPSDWFDEGERQRRILRAWRVGASLLRFRDGDLLRYANPVEVDCARVLGWPLQRGPLSSALLSAPLSRAECAHLPFAELHLVYDASIVSRHAQDAAVLDPSEWLSIAPYALHDPYDDDIVAQALEQSTPQPAKDLRSIFGDRIPAASDERKDLLEALRATPKSQSSNAGIGGGATGFGLQRFDRISAAGLLAIGLICLIVIGLALYLDPGSQPPASAPHPIPHQAPDPHWNVGTLGYFSYLPSLAIVASLVVIGLIIGSLLRRNPKSPAPAKPARSTGEGLGIINADIWVISAVLCVAGLATLAGDISPTENFSGLGILFVFYLLLKGFRSGKASAVARPISARQQPRSTVPPRRKTASEPSRWRRWAQRFAITSQLSRVLGRRQAAYMRHILELFETGALNEALRHAIPIDGNQPSAGPAFGTPQARDSLTLTDGGGRALGLALGEDLQTYLRKLYRQSFEKLDRDGRVEEAVFVLAELLQARQEALDYLEKKQRYEQAAELALIWDRPPDAIVRLQCLAGNWRAAVAVARRDHAFANAVLQLEGKFPEAARRLRLEWAEALIAQGDWLSATDAIWPIEAERHRAIAWIASAEAAGGQLAGRALVQRACLLPETLQDSNTQLVALRDDPRRANERGAIASALLVMMARYNNSGSKQLGRVLMGAILADQSAGRGALSAKDLQRFLSAYGDPALFADMPPGKLPAAAPKGLSSSTVVHEWSAPERGPLAVFDAVALDDDQLLLALGESGAAVVDSNGRILRRFSVPAQRIVIATTRQVALLLARRERLWRVSRVDLVTRQVTDLGMIELQYFADTFDGIAWTLAQDTTVRVLDTQHTLGTALWQFNQLPGPVCGLSACANVDQFLIAAPNGGYERWQYRLPQRRLVARDDWTSTESGESAAVLLPAGGLLELWPCKDATSADDLHVNFLHANKAGTIALPKSPLNDKTLPLSAKLRLFASDKNWVVFTDDDTASRWYVMSLLTKEIHAAVTWPEGAEIRVRACSNIWLMFDNQGRIFRFDTETSTSKGISPR
jgi:hypothetical protein